MSWMTDDSTLKELAESVVRVLADNKLVVATAESCTGGWIAKCLTDVDGSSLVFGQGVVSYSNDAKTRMLGVSDDSLAMHGAVSEAVVREMAEGALRSDGADYAIAVTGIAGPSGGSEEKPVGTVWFGWSGREDNRASTTVACHHFDGDRESVRRQTVRQALDGLLARVDRDRC